MRRLMRTLLVVTVSGAATTLPAQAAPPATDIYLAPLSMRDGRPVVGKLVNVTHR